MSPAGQPRWGRLAFLSLLVSLAAAVVLWFVIDDKRWIAGAVLTAGVIDSVLLGVVVPRVYGRGQMQDQLEQMNAQAQAEAEADDNWRDPEELIDPPTQGT